MKILTLINWTIIALYSIYAIFIYISTHSNSGVDAAGKGMAMGFLLVGLIYLAVLIGLNFINVRWVKILVLLLGVIPMLFAATRAISAHQNQIKYKKQGEEYSKFKDPHLEAMRMALKNSDLREMEILLAKDNSQINLVGENNRETILGIAVRNAFRFENPEASAIVHLVLKNGGNPNISHPRNYLPLAEVGLYIEIPIFKALLEAGADPSALGEHAIPLVYTIIQRARDDSFEKVELLLKHGLDPNIPMGDNQPYQLNFSPVVYAALYKQWAIANILINKGADVNFQPAGPDGRTFWFLLDEKGKEYQESGNVPKEYQELLSNEKIKNRK